MVFVFDFCFVFCFVFAVSIAGRLGLEEEFCLGPPGGVIPSISIISMGEDDRCLEIQAEVELEAEVEEASVVGGAKVTFLDTCESDTCESNTRPSGDLEF